MLAYTRPFHPLDFTRDAAAVFPLQEMIEQLRQEEVYRTAGRTALTLIRAEDLTAVLTIARQGAECEEHFSREPTLFVVLDGELAIESAWKGVVYVPSGSAGALARDVRHKLAATRDCAYLMIIGRQGRQRAAAARPPMIGNHRPDDQSPSRAGLYAIEGGMREAAEEEPQPSRPVSLATLAFSMALAGLMLLFVLPPAAAVLILLSALIGVGEVLSAPGFVLRAAPGLATAGEASRPWRRGSRTKLQGKQRLQR